MVSLIPLKKDDPPLCGFPPSYDNFNDPFAFDPQVPLILHPINIT